MYGTASLKRLGRISVAVSGVLLLGACATSNDVAVHELAPLSAVSLADADPSGWADTLARSAPGDYRAGWASRMMGEPVIDSRGRHLGLLNDLVVHTRTRGVRYAVISSKRPASGERLVAAPVRRLWRTEYGALFLETDRDRFDEQNWWIAERWPGLQDILVWQEMELVPALPPAPAIASDDAYRVSRLMGSYVSDPEGLPLGRIVDIVIDMNRQQVHYAVLRLQGPLDVPPNQAFAVPIQSLTFSKGGGHATLAVPQARVIGLVGTDPDHGPPVNQLRYVGTIDRPFRTNQ